MRWNPAFSPQTFRLTCALVSTCLSARCADFKFPTQTLTVPDGFEVELVAGPPNVNRPIMADFDEQGRLYTADSSGATTSAPQQAKEKPHRIVRLSDTTGNGHFDQSLVFADKLMFPEGVLWHDGALYYSGVPSIWKLEDTDGDGVADQRTEWYQGKTMTGCANDLHGPYFGPDGYIYWCKGAFAQQTHERAGRPAVSDSAAHIFRCRPDGTDFDSIMSGGMDNPVEIAFTPGGETFFTTTFFVNPEGGRRDALVHAVYGGVYPKVHGVLDGLKRTGDLLPAMTHLGPAAPSGLVRYSSSVFGADYEGNLFSTQFNLRKVQRHILLPVGATYRTTDIDFLVSDNPDFHPTDVLEDADGSLLVIDTGGWYKVCCPTSQISKPEVLGAIYRVRRKGAPRIEDPRGLKLDWTSLGKPANASVLARWLDDPRPAVRNRAVEQLAKLGDAAVPVAIEILKSGHVTGIAGIPAGALVPAAVESLKSAHSPLARLNAVWTLARLHTPPALEGVRLALSDADPTVRQAAAHTAGLLRDSSAVPLLLSILQEGSAHLKLTAATSLGQIGGRSAVPALLAAAKEGGDRMLEHSLIYALIEIDDRPGTLQGLASATPSIQRDAMIALDQMDRGDLKLAQILPSLNSNEPLLHETALWVAAHHPEWGAGLTDFLEKGLRNPALAQSGRTELEGQLAQLSANDSIRDLMGKLVVDAGTSPEARRLLLGAMKDSPRNEAAAAWAGPLLGLLSGGDEATVKAALAVIRALPLPKSRSTALSKALLELAEAGGRSENLRLEALATLPARLSSVSPGVFAFLTSQLDERRPPLDRAAAAEILGRASLSADQLEALTALLRTAGPLELAKLLPAYDSATDETLGLKFVEALEQAKGRAALRPDLLRPRLSHYPDSVKTRGEALLLSLNADASKQKRRLDDLEAELSGGERNRGQMLFSGPKAACFTCHAIGYVGGHIGPDLTKIGAIRTRRDLLEAIVYPSASFARGYEPVLISTRAGDQYSGIVRNETPDTLTLVTGPTTEQRIARSEMTEMRPGMVSIMPEGFADQLARPELADLIAFLQSLK
jgi:putative membrane-bound dehydrogenase-like protein